MLESYRSLASQIQSKTFSSVNTLKINATSMNTYFLILSLKENLSTWEEGSAVRTSITSADRSLRRDSNTYQSNSEFDAYDKYQIHPKFPTSMKLSLSLCESNMTRPDFRYLYTNASVKGNRRNRESTLISPSVHCYPRTVTPVRSPIRVTHNVVG